MNRLVSGLAVLCLASGPVQAGKQEPQFHPLPVPPGKSAQSLQPRREAVADEPIVLELRAHRHPDGSLHFDCDHAPRSGPKPKGREDAR